MAVKLHTHALVTIAATNTRQALSATDLWVTSYTLKATSTNAAAINVGDSTVTTSIGMPVGASETITIDAGELRGNQEEFNLADVYVVGTQNDTARLATIRRSR